MTQPVRAAKDCSPTDMCFAGALDIAAELSWDSSMDTPPPLPRTFHRPGSGGCVALFSLAFLSPMAIGAYRFLTMEQGLDPSVSALAVGGLAGGVLLALYIFFGSTSVYTVSQEGLLVQTQYGLGPLRGALRTDYELRWATLPAVYDVTARHLSKNGNMNTTLTLELGEHTLSSGQFGTMGRDGDYLAFIECVRAAIGPKLVSREDLGDLEGPLARMVDARLAERARDQRSDQSDDAR